MSDRPAADPEILPLPLFRGGELEFRRLLDKLPAAAYTCDADGLITYFNQQAIEIWGRAPKLNDSVDRYCGSFRLFSADGVPIPHDECWMALAVKNGREYNGHEIVIERTDGSRVTGLAHANPLYDKNGAMVGAVNVLVDISDRKRAEQVQQLLASVVESTDDAIISMTLDGHIMSWNLGAEHLFGYPAVEAVGRPITMIVPPERLPEVLATLARLREGERIAHHETVRVAKSGQQIHVSLSVCPIHDSTGKVVGLSKVARDITAQKEAEGALLAVKDELAAQLADLARLHEMSARLSTTLELQPILEETLRTAMAIDGADKGMLSLCSADATLLERGASIGHAQDFLQAVSSVPAGAGACGSALVARRRVVSEDIETDPNFEPFRPLFRAAGIRAVHSTPLITRSGKVLGVLSTHFSEPHRPTDRNTHLIDLCARQAVDFIENAQLYVELREADRRKDEFLALLAHELRNPLAPLTNSLQLLRMAGDLTPAAEHVHEIMDRQLCHLVRLVDDLLEVSRITRGKIELRKEVVDLTGIIGSAVETSLPLIEAAGHRLAISLSQEPLYVEADPVRLAQVIANLLNNAAKYTERKGQIWLTARPEGGEAIVSVRDTGFGIPAHMLPRIFDMFAQVDHTLTRAQGGLGIGLTLAKSLVHLHEGRIEALSEGLGKGSEFLVRLPLVSHTPLPREVQGETTKTVSQLPRRRILLVDDTRAALFTLGKLLETMGQEVRTALDGPTALKMAREERPDLVISDIAMPLMDGYELAQRLRAQPGFQYVSLVALTGYGQDSDRRRGEDAGFDRHLVKPISIDVLAELLHSLPQPEERDPARAAHRHRAATRPEP